MGVFDDKQVKAAIARVPGMSTKELRTLLERAIANRLPQLQQACEAELELRPIEFTKDEAERARTMAAASADMSLLEAIRYAFGVALPASPAERSIIAWIGQNPGTTFEATRKHYGKGDLGLAVGHLVYDRFGCFRRFVHQKADQSSVLLDKDRGGKSVSYTWKPEARQAFGELGLV